MEMDSTGRACATLSAMRRGRSCRVGGAALSRPRLHGFGQRSEIENRIGRHRDAMRINLAISERAAIDDLVAPTDFDYGKGILPASISDWTTGPI